MKHYLKIAIYLVTTSLTFYAYANNFNGKEVENYPIKIFKGLYLGSLLNEPIDINSTQGAKNALNEAWYSNIVVISKSKKEKVVNNCQKYFEANKLGMEPVKEYERSAYFEFAIMCIATIETARSKPAKMTFIDDFTLNEKSPRILPKQFSMVISDSESKEISNNKKLIFWIDVNKIETSEKTTNSSVKYKTLSTEQELSFVTKADFNNDNIQDLLIISKDSVVGGNYSSLRMFLITKLSKSDRFIVLKEFKPYK